jgi:hypothetical protein
VGKTHSGHRKGITRPGETHKKTKDLGACDRGRERETREREEQDTYIGVCVCVCVCKDRECWEGGGVNVVYM